MALVLMLQDHLPLAAELVGAADGLRDATATAPRPWEIDATERCMRDLRAGLEPAEFEGALHRGRELELTDILERVKRPGDAT